MHLADGAYQVERQLARLPAVPPEREETVGRYYDLAHSAVASNQGMLEVALAQPQGSKMFAAGRVLVLRDEHFDFDVAVVVRPVADGLFLVLAAVSPERKAGTLGELHARVSTRAAANVQQTLSKARSHRCGPRRCATAQRRASSTTSERCH